MSEEDLEKLQDTDLGADLLDAEKSTESEIIDFDQNGRLLKIATDGISVLDYVKRMKESGFYGEYLNEKPDLFQYII